ncbi:cytochrome P450 CYP736A12-like [Silene latifolia]|uniref:cytochrome P450 CYP736A12-like n=1 Tax=Silene latifolia TaxID=37657 RepID=UPI003D78702C
MEITQLLVLTLTFIILPLLYLTTRPKYKLPPGPRPLPLIGNIHLMGKLPHRSMANLAKKYGPIMTMRLGSVPGIVVSTSDAAKLFLKDHDLVFASRPALQAVKYLWYEGKAVGLAPYGESWRKLRKMMTLQLLTASKVDSFAWLRKAEIGRTLRFFKDAADKGAVADVGKKMGELTEDIMFKMIVGKGKEEDKRYDLQNFVEQVLQLGGAFNMADYVPLLAPFDLQGLTRKMKKVSKELDVVLEAIIEDHLTGKGFVHNNDLLGIMLEIMKNPTDIVIDRVNIKAVMLDLFGAGIDTIGHTIEWAMAAMVKDPRIMNVLKKELDSVVGDSRMVEETDFPKLPYLDMVAKETFRLYPGAPLLLPRESMEDIVLNGYMIPKKSRIIINFWGIARDPNDWGENADEFYPERFANGGGQHFGFFPFGGGRRLCPGAYLGTVTVKIVLAQLVHCFDWKLPGDEKPEDMDMSEKFGIAIPRVDKLYLIPSYRLKVACP